ncbi:MAG: dihydroorotate dehydrogenase electron transfer subunit [Bacteroidota bacterium]
MPLQQVAPVLSNIQIAEGIFLLTLESKEIAQLARPGQFVNIRSTDGSLPFLRRPFSISHVHEDSIDLMFNIVGQGTRMMASRRVGDTLDVLGPLGKPFGYEAHFETAILVGGGLGVAPFPLLTRYLKKHAKKITTFLGGRTSRHIVSTNLENIQIATDDGSSGFHGTVVSSLESYWGSHALPGPKIFGCGPTPMLRALSETAQKLHIACELSLEGDMACGVGLCQGCPVETTKGERKYALVCVEGPTFNCNDIILR